MNELICSFSGGRTSAFMARMMQTKTNNSIKYVFANTGLEHEKTLEFINRCSIEWGIDIIWLESVTHKGRKGSTHKVVTYETATRGRALFESMIKEYGIPNKAWPHCNRELKLNPIQSWKRENNLQKLPYAIGIRIDEIDRMTSNKKGRDIIYPLISMFPTAKPEILDWWKKQPFNLEIEEHYGNCVTCWKKSTRKLLTLAKNTPEYFNDFDYLERNYKNSGSGSEERQFLSGARFNQDRISIRELVGRAHCEPFKEFKEVDPEYQLDMFGFDAPNGGCSESCEPFLQ
jgi:hypothetical protein